MVNIEIIIWTTEDIQTNDLKFVSVQNKIKNSKQNLLFIKIKKSGA